MKKLALIFAIAFLLNLVWENLHVNLYAHFQGGPITQFHLWRATLFDATFITVLAILFIKNSYFRQRLWWSLVFGLAAAVLIEVFAIKTNWWSYNDLMPIIPLFNIGLTPALQLGLLSFVTYNITGLGNTKTVT